MDVNMAGILGIQGRIYRRLDWDEVWGGSPPTGGRDLGRGLGL